MPENKKVTEITPYTTVIVNDLIRQGSNYTAINLLNENL